MQGFFHIACGKEMKVQDQQKKLFDFVYGEPPDVVSNYELLVKVLSNYADLYEEGISFKNSLHFQPLGGAMWQKLYGRRKSVRTVIIASK